VRLEIIQSFINAADAVLGQNLRCTTRVHGVCMDREEYRRHGIAATVSLQGDVEGQVVFDLDAQTARQMALEFAGSSGDVISIIHDVVCELANLVIGNAVSVLNDSGYRFRVQPPQITSAGQVPKGTADVEALVMKFETSRGPVFMNIALRARKDFAADCNAASVGHSFV
jgi:CheY-specific phosphatase CheX